MEDFDPREWPGHEAADLVRSFAEVEKLAAAGKTLAAGRVEATDGWKPAGHRSAEEWLARETGTSTSSASRLMATGRFAESIPDGYTLTPWWGLIVLVGWVIVGLAVALVLLRRRDA